VSFVVSAHAKVHKYVFSWLAQCFTMTSICRRDYRKSVLDPRSRRHKAPVAKNEDVLAVVKVMGPGGSALLLRFGPLQ